MKNILFLSLLCLVLGACSSRHSVVNIPAQASLELNYAESKGYRANLKNKSGKDIQVSVVDKTTGTQVSGFGLGGFGRADVWVKKSSKLVLKNPSDKNISLKVDLDTEAEPEYKDPEREYVNFTLRNPSAKSIPLLIPSVMNPNLSPYSKSGVELKMGQKILFRQGGKKYVLLVVDEQIKEGDSIDVAALLKARKKELGL